MIITSMVKYHLKDPEDDKSFINLIKKLMTEIHEQLGITIHYISRELYDIDSEIYPSKGKSPHQAKVIMQTIENGGDFVN